MDENAMQEELFYVGDLCYVLEDEVWPEVCDRYFGSDSSEIELSDGRQLFMLGTLYGDGFYQDDQGRGYSVDSGTIGAVRISDLAPEVAESIQERGLGNVIPFQEGELSEDTVYSQDGVLMFGFVSINTGYEEEEEDLDEGWEEEDEEE